jgi:hypothetical protein
MEHAGDKIEAKIMHLTLHCFIASTLLVPSSEYKGNKLSTLDKIQGPTSFLTAGTKYRVGSSIQTAGVRSAKL